MIRYTFPFQYISPQILFRKLPVYQQAVREGRMEVKVRVLCTSTTEYTETVTDDNGNTREETHTSTVVKYDRTHGKSGFVKLRPSPKLPMYTVGPKGEKCENPNCRF